MIFFAGAQVSDPYRRTDFTLEVLYMENNCLRKACNFDIEESGSASGM